jgi:chromosome segregation ATPase
MASYTTEEEITVTAEIDLEIAVQDQDGNDIECDVDGYGFSLTAQIDTQSIKDNMLDDVREEIKDELRDELRDELQEELKGEFKSELCKEIANADSPMRQLAFLFSDIADHHEGVSNTLNASISTAKTKLADQADEIRILKHNVVEKDLAIDNQRASIESLQRREAELEKEIAERPFFSPSEIPEKITIKIDPPKEDK